MLEVNALDSGYGFLQILWGVTLSLNEGEFVGLIGPNGAGKSTTLKTIAGLVTPRGGSIRFKGDSIFSFKGNKVCRTGIAYISEDMNLFTRMTVRENLAMGAYTVSDKSKKRETLDFVYGIFPRLLERENQMAGTMSGGERKMLAIGRGVMSQPSLMLVDEPSLGLAPLLTKSVFEALDVLRKRGVTILLVEQNVNMTLRATDRAYIMEKGRIVLEGKSKELARNDYVRKVFLGV